MDIYKTSERKQRFSTNGYQGYIGKYGRDQLVSGRQNLARRHDLNASYSVPEVSLPAVPDAIRIYEDYQGCFALEQDIPSMMRSINESKMSTIVRQAYKRDHFRIQGWRVRKLADSVSNPLSMGIYRFEGVGCERNEWLDWSILLKIIQSPANLGYDDIGVDEGRVDEQSRWDYWKRELLVYQSRWLDGLPEGIRAPACYEAQEAGGNLGGIWLEDARDSYSGNWPLARYALAARHLGRLNGVYISRRELPTFPWLSRQRTRQWLQSIPWQAFPWDHPLVWQRFTNPGVDRFRGLLQEHEHFLDALEQLPKTINLGDTYPTNFISRHLPHNQEQTLAMNWSQAGIEPLGDDLGQLVYGTYLSLKGYKLRDISETLFTSYVNGLQDSGCHFDIPLVRFGYTASAAFRMGLAKLVQLDEQLKYEDYSLHPAIHSTFPEPFESFMASEAYRLLDEI